MTVKSLLAALFATLLSASAFELPARSTQLVVGRAANWNSNQVELTTWEKRGGKWTPTGRRWQGRLGKQGLVWGLGIHPLPAGAKIKSEGDQRTPAGVFYLGGAWGYDARIQKHPKLFYRQITPRDLWVEDPASKLYNQHVVLERDPSTPWEKKQQMRQGDPPHALKLFIAHNAPPNARPGAGSAIFFHIWRQNGSRPTAGCTTLAESSLRDLIRWIDPGRHPLYVILPEAEYQRYRASWGLP